MNVVIPMAGRGSRFAEAGYETPKPLLEAHGKTLLEWSVDSLPLDLATRLIFAGLREHRDTYDLETTIAAIYPAMNPLFLWLDEPTRGQAETVWKCRHLFDLPAGLLIFNIDTAFRSAALRGLLESEGNDGVLGSFESREPRFSYASLGDDNTIREVKEKQVISRHALTGLYHFRRTADFLEIAAAAIAGDERVNGEFYVAPLYDRLIVRGRRFVVAPSEKHWILGTPAEYEAFLAADEP